MTFKTLFHYCLVGIALIMTTGCTVAHSDPVGSSVVRIALLAPFEGRYREVGYDLLYAARLALRDAGISNIELLPIDDGGTTQNAADHVRALALNPAVQMVLTAGYPATDPQVQAAYEDLPVLVIGEWGATPVSDHMLILAGADLAEQLTAPARIDILDAADLSAPVTGGEVFALKQFPLLRLDTAGIIIAANVRLPDTAFTERYLASDQFVPQPGLLVTLAYDATQIAAHVAAAGNRAAVLAALKKTHFNGVNGTIEFKDGYWLNAPIQRYQYDSTGKLQPVS